MTGGRAVVLGRTGRNFAAGMSGGVAYVLDEDGTFNERCNMGLVGFDPIEESDAIELHGLIEEHAERTGSPVAERILTDWAEYLPQFVKVMPHDYKRALNEMAEAEHEFEPCRVDRWRGLRRHGVERLMGKIGAFLEIARVEQPERDPANAHGGLQGVRPHPARRGPARAGRALHGVRRAVLPQRLPAGQPDPGLERPRLPRPLARGDRPAARDQQLPRVHRQALPRPVRGGVRAGDPRGRRGHDQADRGLDRQSRVGRGLDRAAAAEGRDRPHGGRDRRRPGRARGRAAAAPRRPRGHRLRARRGRRRPGPLRRPALQDREVGDRAAARAADRRGRRVPLRRGRRLRRRRGRAARRPRRRRHRHRLARPARSPGPRPRARRGPLRDGVPVRPRAVSGREHRRRTRSRPPESTSWSSAAATPAPTASATRTARAPRR